MNAEIIRLLSLVPLACGLVCTLSGADASPAPARDPFTTAIAEGKLTANLRTRYENVDQTNLRDANALTLRTRVGYTTGAFENFTASLEFENIAALDGDAYSQAGINPGGAGRAVVADPEGTEINQVWLAYAGEKLSLKGGRQRLVFDNARFVGDVGWRQNMQTFDALVLTSDAIDHVALTYGYLDRINRVFGADHAQGVWDSDSHVLHVTYAGIADVKLAGYAHLLDFANSAANSCATYGVSATGTRKLDATTLNWRLEYAHQSDYGNNPADYSTHYVLAEGGATAGTFSGALGYEVLGSDNGVGFKTPLATLHAFNGWADLFLNTPAGGLRDVYAKVSVKLPRDVTLLGFYHEFDTDSGDSLGSEWDLQVAWKISQQCTALAKYAAFRRDTTALPNVSKLWLQVEFAY